jgi:cell pole-organizing protein PopZ
MGDMSAEPSMEDILSSIKRIIAEEGETATAASRARRASRIMNPQAQPGGFGHDEILELSDPVRVSDEEAPVADDRVANDRPAAAEPASESPAPFSRPANAPVELLLRRRLAPPAETTSPSPSAVEPAPAAEPAPAEPAQSAPAIEVAQAAPAVKPAKSAPAADPVPSPPVADPILSSRAADASRGSLDALSRLVVKPEVAGSDSLEGLVREMLRPMLREWLDSHLPAMVETMVSREIARITGSR